MTNDELAKKIDEKFAGVDTKFAGIDDQFTRADARFDEFASKIDKRFESLENKMAEGFEQSKIRDEELRGLMTFGLEAREVLRDEVHRRFDEADRKHDEQITLLKDAVEHGTRPITPSELAAFVKKIGLSTPSESAQMIREDRDDPDR